MSAVAQAGRTVLFVSHSMPSVSLLCGRAILLEGGQIALDGSTNQTIEKYLLADAQITGTWRSSTPDQAAAPIQLLQARILKPSGEPAAIVGFQEGFQCEIEYKIRSITSKWILAFRVIDSSGQIIFTSWDTDSLSRKVNELGNTYRSVCSVLGAFLRPGVYCGTLIVQTRKGRVLDMQENAFRFQISPAGYLFNEDRRGVITPILEWRNERSDI